jgi:predicted nucleic acid-binding protein
MKYVLDSSVALKWVLPEPDSPKAIALRDDFRNQIHELLAPDFFALEVLHALTRAERQNRIPVPQGGIHWRDVMSTCPLLVPSLSLAPGAYLIASPVRTGVYDCLYVALAEQERCEFVTADDRLIRNLQPQFPLIKSLASFP